MQRHKNIYGHLYLLLPGNKSILLVHARQTELSRSHLVSGLTFSFLDSRAEGLI